MNITTKSGKTIKVDDESYIIDCVDGAIKHVFVDTSTYQSRIYTIRDDDIEVIDEKWSQERIDSIAKMVGNAPTPPAATGAAGYV